MITLYKISRRLELISTFVGRASAWLIIALIAVIISDITLRHWFVIGSTKLQELEWHLNGALFLLCLGWAYTRQAHVRIELFSDKLSKRKKAWIELIGCLFFLLPYVTAILVFSTDYVAYSIEYNESSASATGLPYRWIIKSMIITGFITLGLAGLSRFIDSLLYLFAAPHLAAQTSLAQNSKTIGLSG